ncbi:phage tail protein [Lactococcus raffinolactis]|uniref:phage tail protein n=1 Tax=Pseudolactococcus raffinolactis TaxID=1366 RepID=UPI0028A09F6A|nr:phage tail protein [Lactococcus raffinolactis]
MICWIVWEVIHLAFNIFELSGKISADNKPANDAIDETTGKAKESGSIFSTLGNGLKVVGAGMVAVAGVAGAAAVGLSKKVIGAYAEYEQLVGGVDTLFKEASSKVQGFADNAYKTAGMSANVYMETVTGFSASLIQSLGGDTQKAADVGNQAVTDMSDNANKMGTDITNIQNAYQGFAKQNYTMLDNLKLGYGGTKEEMQRLLVDAEKISGVKYDISSFADVTEAIHVMQTQMGITGTTAAEAADTISGSIDSTKSALTNLWAGLGNPKADVQKLVNDVTNSLGNVVKNITPVLNNIVTALPTLINGVVSAIGGMLPNLLQAVTSLFTQVLQTILTILPSLIPVFVNALMTIVQAIISNLPLLISAAVQLVTTLVQGIATALPTLIPAAVQAVVTIVQGLIDNLPLLLDAGLQLLTGLLDGLITAIPILIAALPQIITSLVTFFVTSIPIIINAGIQLLTALVTALPQIIAAIVAVLPQIINGIITALIAALPQLINAGIQLFLALITALPQIISAIAGAMPQIINGITSALIGNIDQIINAGVALLVALVQNLPQIMTSIGAAIPQIISSIVTALGNGVGEMARAGLKLITGVKDSFTNIDWASVGSNIISGVAGGITGAATELLDAAGNAAGNALDWMKKKLGIHSPSRVFRDEVGKFIPAGIAVGIEQEAYTMQDALDTAANGLTFDTVNLGANIIDPAQVSMQGSTQQMNFGSNSGTNDESLSLLRLMIAKIEEILNTKFNIYLDKTLISKEIEKSLVRGV